MIIQRFPHPEYTSNTYLIRQEHEKAGWLVDAGQVDEVLEIEEMDIRGVFLTHAHYDHIYGLNKLIERFPDLAIYVSGHTRESLGRPRLNLSFYHEMPIEVKGGRITVVEEGDRLPLFGDRHVEILETPGHNLGCLTFILGDVLFTGDSYIPGIPVVTKLKGGDKEANAHSLKRIKTLLSKGMYAYPGHGEIFSPEQLTGLL